MAQHKHLSALCLLLLSFAAYQPSTMADTQFAKNLDTFSSNVYEQLAILNPNKNIIFSPFSIQTCAAMVRIGAENETAKELDEGLKLSSSNVDEIANSFGEVLAEFEKSNILKIANKVYIMKGYSTRETFSNILATKFLSKPENIDFAKNTAAAGTINGWVESKTNNLIKDLVSPDVLDSTTRLVLVNAIHFKGEWITKFEEADTVTDDFYLNDYDKVQIPMMNVKSSFRYADLKDLDAKALEMPYKGSDLSMLIILPNQKTGLKNLEQKLKSAQLADITGQLYETQVIVKFPKFKAEFQQELTPVFKQLGMNRIFSDNAEFGKILESDEGLKVSQIIHKAFIEVNEEGTEAAAATGFAIVPHSFPMRPPPPPKLFIADRPFYFIIKNSQNGVFFGGRLIM